MTIEIVDFPIKHGGSFHSYVTVYQRVHWMKHPFFATKKVADGEWVGFDDVDTVCAKLRFAQSHGGREVAGIGRDGCEEDGKYIGKLEGKHVGIGGI